MKLPKTSPRRLLYLLGAFIACFLLFFVSKARLQFYQDIKKANKAFLSTHIKQDTEAAHYYFYANYRPNTDYIEAANTIGHNATFINICKNESCALFGGNKYEMLRACNKLSSKDSFSQYRVYTCNVKVTLENDQPLQCDAIDNRAFNAFCDRFIASLH